MITEPRDGNGSTRRPNDPIRRRPTIAGAALLAFGLLAVSCAGNLSNDSSKTNNTEIPPAKKVNTLEADDVPTPGGRLIVAVPAETNGWNPSINQWADAGSLEGSAFLEPLATLDPNGDAKPWLAEKWTSNADFTEWEITLKPNITFHNGQPMDGDALKQNLEFLYHFGLTKIALESQYDHVEKTGPLSAKAFLKHPWSQYPAAMNNIWMMAPEMLNREDQGTIKPIGTGPFIFDTWEIGKFLRAKKNPTYWRKSASGRQLPLLDTIEFRPVTDDDTKQLALSARDVDMALSTSAKLAANSEDDATLNVLRDFNSERTIIMLNNVASERNNDGTTVNPFSNVHARRALAYATDRTAIADLAGIGVQSATQGYRPESKWGLPEGQTGYPDFDVAKAKDEVAKYKQQSGKPSLAFSLTGLTNVQDSEIMQALQAQWKEAGIEARIDAQEQVKYIITIATGGFQAGWFRWYGYPNPDSNYVYNAAEDINDIGKLSINFTHYTSPAMQANLEAGRRTTDFDARKKANDAVIRETNEQVLNVWLYDTPYSLVANKKVRGLNGFRTNPFGNFSPKPWWGDVWIQR